MLWQHNAAWLLQSQIGQRGGSLGEATPCRNSKSRKEGCRGETTKAGRGHHRPEQYGCILEKAEHIERGNGYGEGRLPGDREKPNGQDFKCQVQFRVWAVTCNQSSGNVGKSSIFQQFSLKKVRCKADSQRGTDGQPEEGDVWSSSRVGLQTSSLGGQTQEQERQ